MSLKDRVQSMVSRLEREDVNMHGFLLNVRGEFKAGAYYRPFREGQPHRLYSVSKTMTGLAIGMLTDEGKLNLDQPAADFFPDLLPEHPDARVLRQTIRDMLRMATCYAQTAYREREDADWTRPFFTGTPSHEPGTVFHYDTGASQVLAALARRLSGLEVMDFLEERFFTPLGLKDERFWLKDPSGCCQGGTGLCMSLRDFHSVGQCLADGGRGLVPEWYVRQMTQKQIDTFQRPFSEERHGYGWQCWRTRAGWSMYGLGGQLCIVCPDREAVLTTTADTRLDPFGTQKIYDAFFEEVYPWLGTEDMEPEMFALSVRTLPDNPAFRRAETGPHAEAGPLAEADAFPAAGPYLFEEGNPLRLKTLSLRENCLRLERAEGAADLPFRPGEWLETAWPGRPDVPAIVTSGRTAPGELRLRCHAVGTAPCGFEMLLVLRQNTATVQCFRSHDPLTDDYDGVASGTRSPAPENGADQGKC